MRIKTLALGLVSLAGMLAATSDASAFFWRHRCCDRYQSVIICRPYNAFTPICSGSMTCDGCCPTPCCAPSALPSFQPWCGPSVGGCDPGMGGHAAFGAPMMRSLPAAMPVGPPAGPVAMGGGPNIYQANYQGGYYPNYYPQNYYPQNYYPQNYYPGFYPMVPMNAWPMVPPQNYYQGGYGYPGASR